MGIFSFLKSSFVLFFLMIIIFSNSKYAFAYDLSEFPSPFIKDEEFNGVLVVGDKAPAEDVLALSDIIISLQYPILGSNPESVMGLDTMLFNQTKTYSFGALEYEITLNFADLNSAQFIVNGETTNVLRIGQSDMVADGLNMALADIFFEDGQYSATFFMGREKITVEKTKVGEGSAKLASEVEDLSSIDSILIGHACDNPLVAEVKGIKNNCRSGYESGAGFIEAYEFPNGKVSLVITGNTVKDTRNAAKALSFYGYYRNDLRGNKVKVVEDGNRFKITPLGLARNGEKSNNVDFSEIYFKVGLLFFLLLLISLMFLFFKKKPKRK